MNKEFIPYEQALEIEKLGYNENDCILFWYCHVDGHALLLDHPINDHTYMSEKWYKIPAPLYQQAFRWFREKHKLPNWVYTSNNKEFWYSILKDGRMIVRDYSAFNSYEEAELACLRKLIELVKYK